MSLVLRNGLVLTPGGMQPVDVLVEAGRVTEIGRQIGRAEGVDEIDATGCLIGPGLVDIHTHLRDPGQVWKEDLGSGTRSAAAGGFTAVVAMPNTDPPVDGADAVVDIAQRAARVGSIEVAVAGALTRGRAGSEPSDLAAMYEAGVRLFTDDGDCVEDGLLVEELMRALARLPGAVFAQHPERTSLTRGGHMHDGEMSRRLGLGGLPARAESAIVEHDLEVVVRTGARYHCQHVSASATVDLLRQAKGEGLPVTAEVTPHHLSFTDRDVAGLDPNRKMYPPLRTEEDREALRSALLDGTIDVVATDHAPHTEAEKRVGYSGAPRGVIALETAASVVWGVVPDPHRFFECLSTSPAGIAGLKSHGQVVEPGIEANLVVFDPDARWPAERFVSKSANSPYLGMEMTGRVIATVFRGELVHHHERETA